MIIAFSTSTDHGSVAIIDVVSKKIIGASQWTRDAQNSNKQSEALLPQINRLMKKIKVPADELQAVAVDRGPGSFTGTRISVNVAKTMAYTLGIPVLPFCSLEILAAGFSKSSVVKSSTTKILSLIDAHRALVYCRLFKIEKPKINRVTALSNATAEPLTKILEIVNDGQKNSILVCGTGSSEFKKNLKEQNIPLHTTLLSAKILAKLALSHFELNPSEVQSWREVEPSYIRSPDAVEKLQQK